MLADRPPKLATGFELTHHKASQAVMSIPSTNRCDKPYRLNMVFERSFSFREQESPSMCSPKGFFLKKSRGDKTAIELFVAGVRGWGSWRWRQLENSQST